MGKLTTLVVLLALSFQVSAQSTFWTPSDTLNKPRLYTIVGVGGAGAVGSLAGLYGLWYADYPQSGFHFVNDMNNWRGMDKVGHAMTNYTIGSNIHNVLRWSGVDRNEAIWYGGLTGWSYMAIVEVMDGMSTEWGFSVGDFAFNTFGSGLFIGQQLAWDEQRIVMKYSYHNTQYPQYRPELLGSGWEQTWLKDYNGQSYWLSVNPRSFSSSTDGWWPQWLNVAVGYGVTGMTGGSENPSFNAAGEALPLFNRGSQYYLSLDIDLTRLPVKSHFWKGVFSVINMVKIPAPALEYRTTDGNFYFHPLYY